MNSARFIDYELRPVKFTERKMLLNSLVNICQFFKEDYEYIGFGGISFTDFKLFHKELNINHMISIEGGNKTHKNRVEFNKPYHFIKTVRGKSTDVLDTFDFDKKSIIWLDYDNQLDEFMFDDITHIFKKIKPGSVYIFTCNTTLAKDGNIYSKEEFIDQFGNYLNFDFEQEELKLVGSGIILKMLQYHINTKIDELNHINGTNLQFKQLYNFKYNEKGGAPMFTFGGVLVDGDIDIFQEARLNKFEFIVPDENSFNISIPLLTHKEKRLINMESDNIQELLKKNIIYMSDIETYLKIYKYLPQFLDVRM